MFFLRVSFLNMFIILMLQPSEWLTIAGIAVPLLGSFFWFVFKAGSWAAVDRTVKEDIKSIKETSEKTANEIAGINTRLSIVELEVKAIRKRLKRVEINVADLKLDVEGLKIKVAGLIVKVADLMANVADLMKGNVGIKNSPLILNEVGIKILNDSKVTEMTDKLYEEIIETVKSRNPSNPFQVQEFLIEVVSDFQKRQEWKEKLEIGAYNSGSSINTVLLVAAINIRDRVLSDLRLPKNPS